MNTKRNELGQFLPNDLLEPLVWVRAEEVKEDNGINQMPNAKLGTGAAIVEEAGANLIVLAQHTPPPSITVNVGDEEVVLIGLPTKRAKRGQRSNRCCVCGCETDTSKTYYCKRCWAEYQRNRYQEKGR